MTSRWITDPITGRAPARWCWLAAAWLLCAPAVTATAAEAADPMALAKIIQNDVAAIRGLPFKRPVIMEKQTPEVLGQRMDKEAAHAVPPEHAKHFDKIVRRLGLYRGPVIEDFTRMMRTVVTSQVAAYYDPETRRIYLLDEGSSDMEQGVVYSHELYHALQDQYFNLARFTAKKLRLNADQQMARDALIEGEATYVHTLWGIRKMMNGLPPRAAVGLAVQAQANLNFEQMRQQMIDGAGQDAEEVKNIPPFILEVMMGSYLKGAAFVFAVQEKGWAEVEKLYREYPPQSTEQILHPEKWQARENPVSFSWKHLGSQRVLKDWELLDDDVIGEIQWRIIFGVHGLQSDAAAAAAGWGGDRYAVFKRKGSDETLLLLRTAWDSEAEAAQFAEAYRRVLKVKYGDRTEALRLEQQGNEVLIVEGGKEADLDALMSVVRQARKQ